MHLIIATRGNKESVELFIKELSSKYLNIPFHNKKTGETVNVANAIHVRPFQLWEIIFPEGDKDLVLTTIFPDKGVLPDNPKFQKWYKRLLKFLPLKEVPKDWDNSRHLMVEGRDVEVVGLGMKDDRVGPFEGRSDKQMKSIGLDPKGKWEYEQL